MKVRVRFYYSDVPVEIHDVTDLDDKYSVGHEDDKASALKVMTENSSHVFLLATLKSYELLDQVNPDSLKRFNTRKERQDA